MATLLPGNIVYGGPVTCSESENFRSLGHFLLEKFQSHGEKIVMIDAITKKEYTAKMLYDAVVRLAHILRYLGIQDGDVVGVSSENRFEFAVAIFGSFAVNASVAPLNVTYSEREVEHAINLSKPKLMFTSKQTVERIVKVAKNNSFVKHIVSMDAAHSSKEVHSFRELMKDQQIPSQTHFYTPAVNKNEDVALIVCSSGTTGLPKGVQLTHSNILTTLDANLDVTALDMGQATVLTVIPWFHVFGCMTLIMSSTLGATLVYLPKFEERSFLGAIEKYRVMVAFMVPPLMVFLAKHPLVDKYDLSSLLALLCGAAPLSKETEDQIKSRIGVPVIRQGYGLSESTLGLLIQSDDFCKPGSVGSLKKGLYAKVIDPDTGKTLGHNQRGELCFKGDCIMKGYIGDVQSTQSVIKDGWLHTGDVGYFDDDFEFFIVDRIKELIKYKAFQVPPAEIEALLLTNSKIKDAAVIGKPDEEAGELPMAFVVKQDNVNLSEDEVIQYVADRTSPAKRLRGGVIFVNEIPKNPSGKILRRVLRDMLNKMPKSKL